MDQVTQCAVITAIGDRALERWWSKPAKPASGRGAIESSERLQSSSARLSANIAQRTGQWPRRVQTVFTNGKARRLQQRGTTDMAIGWKKRKKEAGSSEFCPAGDPSGHSCGLGSPYSKAGTAEDGLPHPAS